MDDNKLNGVDAVAQLFAPDPDTRALPLPKLEDEAVALLTASNSILNSLAIQGVNIPTRLLTDITIFCREQVGFQIPFSTLATRVVDVGDGGPADQIRKLVYELCANSDDIHRTAYNLVKASETGEPTQVQNRELLNSLGQLELKVERLYQYFGWSKMLVRAAARQKLDADAEANGG